MWLQSLVVGFVDFIDRRQMLGSAFIVPAVRAMTSLEANIIKLSRVLPPNDPQEPIPLSPESLMVSSYLSN